MGRPSHNSKYSDFLEAVGLMHIKDVVVWDFHPEWNKDSVLTRLGQLRVSMDYELRSWFYKGQIWVVRYA